MTREEKYAEKISKLLRKAESTTDAEAEALIEKAQALMTRYAIDEAMLAQVEGKTIDELVTKDITHTGIFQAVLMEITTVVARSNDVFPVYRKQSAIRGQRPAAHVVSLSGFQSDVDRAIMLATSLELQAVEGMSRWWKTRKAEAPWLSKMDAFKERRQFISSFANAAGTRLREAAKAAKADVVAERAAAADVTVEAESESVELVLVSKKEQVNEYVDKKYGRLRSSSRSYQSGSSSARSAGRAAGQRANLGNPGLGSQGRLGR